MNVEAREQGETVAVVSIDAPLQAAPYLVRVQRREQRSLSPASRAIWCLRVRYEPTSAYDATRAVSTQKRSTPEHVPYTDASEASSCVLWLVSARLPVPS